MSGTLVEVEAKWCPFTSVRNPPNTTAVNRDASGVPLAEAMCLGIDCMMWRWSGAELQQGTDRRGHCGLAGQVFRNE